MSNTTNGLGAAATMRALVFTDFHKNELQGNLPVPTIQNPDDVLIRIGATGVCGSDLHGYSGKTGRRTPPQVMGHETAGTIVEIGVGVTGFTHGERVALQPVKFCGNCTFCRTGKTSLCVSRAVLGVHPQAGGAFAQYVVWPQRCLYKIPETLSFADASFAEPIGVCVHALRLADFKPYDNVAVVGCGPIGLITLSILARMGLRRLFASDRSDERLAVAKTLGATHILNPDRDDLITIVQAETNGLGADVTIEAVGIGPTAQNAVDLCKNGGTAIWIGNSAKKIEIDMQSIVTREVRVQGSYAMNDNDFAQALAMLEGGAIDTTTLLTRVVGLSQSANLFNELENAPNIIKCVVDMEETGAATASK